MTHNEAILTLLNENENRWVALTWISSWTAMVERMDMPT